MTGAEVKRARKRLGLSTEEFAARCSVSARTMRRWCREGIEGPSERLIHLLIHTHQGVYWMVNRNFDKARSRRHIQQRGFEAISGGLQADIAAAIGERKPRPDKSKQRTFLQNATADFLNKGNKITRVD